MLQDECCRNKIGCSKQKVGLELKLDRDTKGNKRYYRNARQKRNFRQKVGQQMNEETAY